MTTIPYRYDLQCSSKINKGVQNINRVIRTFCDKYGVPCLDLWILEASKHRNHGLHLNKRGKWEITKQIMQILGQYRRIILQDQGSINENIFLTDETIIVDSTDRVDLSNVT